jgi:hypothetical protein
MSGGGPLGGVEVEVKANLEKLIQGFALGKQEAQKFDRDMAGLTSQSKAFFDQQSKIEAEIRQLARAYDPLHAATIRYGDDLLRINKLEKQGVDPLTISRLKAGAYRELQAATDRFSGSAKAAGASVLGLSNITSAARTVMGLFGVTLGVGMVREFAGMVTESVKATAAIGDFAKQVGFTAQEVQEYRLIAKDFGMSQEDIDGAFKEFNQTVRQAAGGLERPAKLFELLKIKLTDTSGKLKPMNELFLETVDRLGRVGNEAQRAAGQALAFGETFGPKMAQMVGAGSDKIDELRQAVEATGIVLSDEQIQKADETAKKLEQVKNVLNAKIAAGVVENAEAIGQLADAVGAVATACIQGVASIPSFFGTLSSYLDNAVGDALEAIPILGNLVSVIRMIGQTRIPDMAHGLGQMGRAVTVDLPDVQAKPKGSNLDLSKLLAPKGRHPRGGGNKVEDQYDREAAREEEEHLRLLKERTTSLVEINRIDVQLIDAQLRERMASIDLMVKRKSLTASEAAKLKLSAQENADLEKEAANRKMREAVIEQSYQAYTEMAQIQEQGLGFERDLARTDAQRRRIEFEILSLKQEQQREELNKAIALAQEAKDEDRIRELTEERANLLKNQKLEVKGFVQDHLTGIEKFRNDLPQTVDEINEQLERIRFDQFTERLQRAASMARDIGDAFGQFAGDIVSLKNPMDALKSLVSNLAQTMTQNVIVKPVSDWATQHLGIPLAKQTFGKQLTGPDALTAKQFDVALAQATGTLGGLQAALPTATSGIQSITTTAAPASTNLTTLATAAGAAATALTTMAASAGASSASSGILSALGSAGGGLNFGSSFGAADVSSAMDFSDLGSIFAGAGGFASGGFTGAGAHGDVKGVVHANEFVMNAGAVSRYGLPLLSSINEGSASAMDSGTLAGRTGGLAAPTAAVPGGGEMGAAAAMLMEAAQALLHAADAMSGGGSSGGLLGGLLGLATGALVGGVKGPSILGKIPGMLGIGGSLGGGGGGLSGATDFSGLGSIFAGVPGFGSGGFTGSGSDKDVKGFVHANEFVWDASTTRKFLPTLEMISSGRIPGFNGPAAPNVHNVRGGDHYHFGDIVVRGGGDDRSARRSGRQVLGTVQRGLATTSKKGLNK